MDRDFRKAAHGNEPSRVFHAEGNAAAEREQLEWLAKISPEYESKLRSLLRVEAEATEAQDRLKWLVEGSNLQEAEWDSAKHPRTGTPPNPGWWALTGGFAVIGGNAPKVSTVDSGSTAHAQPPATKMQLPADHRGTWIRGTKGHGVFRYHHSLENQRAGLAGKEVRFENQHIALGGFPPESYYGGSAAKASVEIQAVTGTRADGLAADAAMREKLGNPGWQRPKDYRWNHAGQPGSKVMELVHETLHGATAHKGPGAEPRALRRAAGGGGATSRAMGALTVYLTARDVLKAAGVLKPDYDVAEREAYHFRADDRSVFVVRPGNWYSDANREFVAGPRKGQTEKITGADVEQHRKQAEEVWGKYIPGTHVSEPRFIPGTERKSVPLIIHKLGVPYEAGWIDEKGVHYYPVPREIPL